MIYDNMAESSAHTNKAVALMKPRGQLMIEHRVTEKMLEVVRNSNRSPRVVEMSNETR